jgi:hypothetical protein
MFFNQVYVQNIAFTIQVLCRIFNFDMTELMHSTMYLVNGSWQTIRRGSVRHNRIVSSGTANAEHRASHWQRRTRNPPALTGINATSDSGAQLLSSTVSIFHFRARKVPCIPRMMSDAKELERSAPNLVL